jgi:pectin methylesterase-like acyl-CoA thioesterase
MKRINYLIYFTFFFLFMNSGSFCSEISSPKGDIIVALDGTGDFTKIQDAINSVPSNGNHPVVIYIKNGTYNTEKLIVPADKKCVTLMGESREETIISYHLYNCTTGVNGRCPPEDAALWPVTLLETSATLTVLGDEFRAENLTIQNSAGPVSQAQAITIQADKVVFINCNIKGYQDTLYLKNAGKRSYFEGCLVIGRTDYIYGAGIAFFQSCEIQSWGKGWITAPATPESQKYGFVFNECKIAYATNSPRAGDDGNLIRFGRPWHEYPKVAWLHCDITGMLNPEGWGDTWRMDYAATNSSLHLYEFKNTGSGADVSKRAKWAGLRSLTDEEANDYTVQKVLGGSDNWIPARK